MADTEKFYDALIEIFLFFFKEVVIPLVIPLLSCVFYLENACFAAQIFRKHRFFEKTNFESLYHSKEVVILTLQSTIALTKNSDAP